MKITDEEDFSISSSTVYRLLKQEGLVAPKPVTDMPTAKSWWHKTKCCDEIWQSDATHYLVMGWGFYKQITVQDDYSRNPLDWDVKWDEIAFSISEVVEKALENAKTQRHLQDGQMPKLLSDNDSGFTSKILAGYLDAHGIKHVFGKPYYPRPGVRSSVFIGASRRRFTSQCIVYQRNSKEHQVKRSQPMPEHHIPRSKT